LTTTQTRRRRKFQTEATCGCGAFFSTHGVPPYNGRNFQGDLEDALRGDFEFRGKFALSETFTPAPLPGLYIQGIGTIGFPLSERDAKLIEAAAIRAPFGKGTETVVDTAVRDTFEINPDKFSFKNPAWAEFLQTVTKKVADGLGLHPNRPLPRAELYKLLLYKTGSQSVCLVSVPSSSSDHSPVFWPTRSASHAGMAFIRF